MSDDCALLARPSETANLLRSSTLLTRSRQFPDFRKQSSEKCTILINKITFQNHQNVPKFYYYYSKHLENESLV